MRGTQILIGALCAAALLLILAITIGSDLGETGGRALATVAIVAILYGLGTLLLPRCDAPAQR